MNYIPQICKMLGVEIGEEFTIDYIDLKDNTYKFTETDLILTKNGESEPLILYDILNGDIKIIKLPFEPKVGEKYYYIDFLGINCKPTPCSEKWEGNNCDYQAKFCGNCFRTWEEANKHAYEIYKKLTGREWE